uniref:Uncharacterized protein n=1 Tax=Anguilla anguilla TaxID=7936 RepID=A0A0E9PFG7_ANGAN
MVNCIPGLSGCEDLNPKETYRKKERHEEKSIEISI